MPDFFSDKQYNDYFEKLSNQLELEKTVTTPKKAATSPKKPKGFYKVIRIRRGVLALVLCLVLLVGVVLSVKSCSSGKTQQTPGIVAHNKDSQTPKKTKKIVYTKDKNTLPLPDTNDAKAGIIVRLSDNKIIAERSSGERIYPASTLKVMTLLTAVDYVKDWEDTFTMSYEITDPLYVAEASVAGFLNNETVTVRDLAYGMILPSGADGAMGLAIKIAGSEEEFVKLMNKKVKELGLKNTHFTNVSGLFGKDNYSTAYDMAVILNAAYNNEFCKEVLSTYKYTTSSTAQHPEGITLSATLFNYMYGTEPETATVLGGKTGFVNEAGYCIASFGKNISETEEYIVVTMGNSAKWPAFYGQIDLYKEFAK